MSTSYNHPTRHYLQPVAGFDMMNHLNFVAPMDVAALTADNGSQMPAGIPAGSVMHLESSGFGPAVLKTGATGSELPMFLLYNSWDPDAITNGTTADGTEITAIPAQSAGIMKGSSEVMGGYADSESISRMGGANLLPPSWSATGVDNTSGYGNKVGSSYGAHTVWPATCGMELSTTEWDLAIETTGNPTESSPSTALSYKFKPGTLLTSPHATAASTVTAAVGSGGHGLTAGTREYYQHVRGGYVTPISAATENVCGVVSRGMRVNEHGVPVVYFHACYRPYIS